MNKEEIIKQIDEILKPKLSGSDSYAAVNISRIAAAIDRLAPDGSQYRKLAGDIVQKFSVTNDYYIPQLGGILHALRSDYEAGYLENVEGLIRADIFADFISMAQHLLSQGYKDPAAVIIGGVLEEHLRKLSEKNSINTTDGEGEPVKSNSLNTALYKADAYSGLDQKNVTAWLDLRNKAAHGKYAEYDQQQVETMLQGVLGFLTRVPG